MKTYTLTWRRFSSSWRKNGLCRCRFDLHSCLWSVSLSCTPIEAFAAVLSGIPFLLSDEKDFRLVKCGKLVARSATYQGV